MADKEKKVDEALEPVTEQVEVERVGDAEKAEAEAVEALPKVEEAVGSQGRKDCCKAVEDAEGLHAASASPITRIASSRR